MPAPRLLKNIRDILRIIYNEETAGWFLRDLINLMEVYGRSKLVADKKKKYDNRIQISEKDSVLITYPDSVYTKGEKPLKTLLCFLEEHIKDAIPGVHILPFFPSSSDCGFAVINYKQVDPHFGSWADIRSISGEYRLMVDLILNHVSSKSRWFQKFLKGDRRYRDYFIWYDNKVNLPEVFRPRETPLLTRFQNSWGEKYVWTTFSPDQIDLNYRNPRVLMRIIDVLLFYLSQGAEILRLDAVGYIWKKPHSRCVNLSKTHQIVKLIRKILEYTAPYALILTEANFPYKENIAYFGEGDEAHIVYQFALPPLVLDAFIRQDTGHIREVTKRTREDLLFFDFLASHDGIGLSGARGILHKKEMENLLRLTESHGGFISYEIINGRKVPYELNINYFDAINDPAKNDDALAVKRFIASQAIMLALKGIPGIYIHSLLGSRNYTEGVRETGIKRMINREKLTRQVVDKALSNKNSIRHAVFHGFLHLLDKRKKIRAFHPYSSRELIDTDKRILAIRRQFEGVAVSAVINVSDKTISLPRFEGAVDLLTCESFNGQAEPYGVYFFEG